MAMEREQDQSSQPSWEEIDKYLAGEEVSPAEMQYIRSYVNEYPGLEQGLRAGVGGEREKNAVSVQPAWLEMQQRIAGSNVSGRGYSARTLHGWLKSVGALSSVIAIVVFGIRYFPVNTASDQFKIYTTAPAQRATVTLSDGSTAILAPSTTLRVSNRSVELDGEAAFTVSHKSGDAFVVKAGNSLTRVLGTSFSVRKYPQDKFVRVAVAEGRVAIDNSILSNGDIAIAENNIRVLHDAERVAALLGFAQGELIIDGRSFSEVIPDLERWYDIKIELKSPRLAERLLRFTLSKESTAQALNLIAELTESRYERNGRIVTFIEEK